MIFFTGIIFIAELIILYNLVVFIINTDRKVCALTEHVEKRRTILRWRMETLTEISQGINEIMPNVVKKLKKSRRNLIIRGVKDLTQSVMLLFFKPKYKKMLVGAKFGIGIFRKFLKI